jgi:hypothetical protein
MGILQRRHAFWLLTVAVFVAGCNGEDTQRLAHVGRKVLEKIESATGNADGKLFGGLQVMRSAAEPDLAGRVSARLRWDRSLADAKIEVSANGAIVELKGSVRDPAQKKRALDLAESTEGVDRVTDSLELAAHDP